MPSSFLSLLVSAGETTASWSSRRLRVEDLYSNLCCLLACSRTSLPVPVTFTRLAVPLWVFCFGMSSCPVRCASSVCRCRAAARGCCTSPPRECGGARHDPGPGLSGAGRLLLGGRLRGGGPLGCRPFGRPLGGPFGRGLPALRLRGLLGLLRLRLLVPVRGDHHDHVPAVL